MLLGKFLLMATPFGGPGIVVECDERKFDKKSKVKIYIFLVFLLKK